jgi:hypothetical protein
MNTTAGTSEGSSVQAAVSAGSTPKLCGLCQCLARLPDFSSLRGDPVLTRAGPAYNFDSPANAAVSGVHRGIWGNNRGSALSIFHVVLPFPLSNCYMNENND